MTSRLVRSPPDQAVRVAVLARIIVLCSWARDLTLTVTLSAQVYKWAPANLMLGDVWGIPAIEWHPIRLITTENFEKIVRLLVSWRARRLNSFVPFYFLREKKDRK